MSVYTYVITKLVELLAQNDYDRLEEQTPE
jgi:flagellin-specific chaperone FliS